MAMLAVSKADNLAGGHRPQKKSRAKKREAARKARTAIMTAALDGGAGEAGSAELGATASSSGHGTFPQLVALDEVIGHGAGCPPRPEVEVRMWLSRSGLRLRIPAAFAALKLWVRQAFAFDEAPFELYHFPTEECVHSERIKVNGPASYEAFKHTLRMQLPGVPVMWAYPLPPPASGSVATSPPQGPVPAGAAATAAASTSAVAAAAATAATAAVITAGASATAGSTPSGRRA